ncbi:hypothetical protein PlfCFBP13513_02185 [Plantibacter flavus]|nr:hypothetical protein PlfCFBP13513_02185 [Plantibacter flavus]
MNPASEKVTVDFCALLVKLGSKRIEVIAQFTSTEAGSREWGESIADSCPVSLIPGLDAEVQNPQVAEKRPDQRAKRARGRCRACLLDEVSEVLIPSRVAGVSSRTVDLVMECRFRSIASRYRGQSLNLPQRSSHSRDRDRHISALLLAELIHLIQQPCDEGCRLLVALDELWRTSSSHVHNHARLAIRGLYSQVIDRVCGVSLK